MIPAIPFDTERLARLMREQEMDVVLASTRHNVRYLTGGYYLSFFARAPRFGGGQYVSLVGIPAGRPEAAFYVGRKDGILNEEEHIEAAGGMWIADRHWVERGPSMSAAAADRAAQALRDTGLAGARIGIESSFLPADAFEALRTALPEARFTNATPLLGELRALKRPAELEALRRVHLITAEAIRATLSAGRAEQTTREVAAGVQRQIEARGAVFLYALTNVGPGLLRAPSPLRWGRGNALHLDAGAELGEYVADVARMGSIGAPSALARDLFQACVDAQEGVRDALGAGMTSSELYRIGADTLRRSTWGEYGRFLAHGIGMVSHEPPEINAKSHRPLEPSTVLSLETEFRHPDAGHIKLEDTVVVTSAGCDGLGDVEREWCVVPA